MKKTLIVLILLCLIGIEAFGNEGRLLRFPNASRAQITFCYGGDIYVAPIAGGLARRITTSEGIEMFPRFSPDGETIAFCGEYDGNRELYTMPANGGEPKRVTYSMDVPEASDRMGPDKIVVQWTADGNRILYRARYESWNPFIGKLYFINKNGGLPEELPLPRGGFASISPDGSKMAYNRIFREFRTWKRYRGGMADDVWIYDFKTKKIENITNNKAQDIIPMWYGDKIFFMSDRDRVMNIFVYDTKTKETRKVTDFKEFDCKFPSLGSGGIAFENGGYIYLMEPNTEKYNKINIEISGDFPYVRQQIMDVKGNTESFEIAPDGKRAMFVARGDVFTVPAKNGNIRNLTKSVGVHDRNAVWSPNGKWIAYISDATGKDEIYIMKPDGSDKIQLTNNAESYRYELLWSPDSKKLLSSDKTMKLYYIDIATKETKVITQSKFWEIRDYSWSPDNKWIAYSDPAENSVQAIFVYNLESEKINQVSHEFFECYSPEFSFDGKYLFFISNRDFNPRLGNFEMSYVYNEISKIYGITLQDTLKTPFEFKSDETAVKEDSDSKESKKEKKKEKEKEKDEKEDKGVDIKIDFDGIVDRIFELPGLSPANYGNLVPLEKNIYYTKSSSSSPTAFYAYDLEKKKESEVGKITSFEISADGKSILFRSGEDYYIEKLDASVKPGEGKLDLKDMKVSLDRKEEWKQIYDEAWRQMKYFFYDSTMHGYDWDAIHERYAQLVPYVVHRADLTYILGEMIAELNCGHTYVGGGDMPKVSPVLIGLLGADLVLDKQSGFYKITKIFPGRNWEEETRSPFTEPGIQVKVGDYITAIDGQTLTAEFHPYIALVNKANKFVTLSINSKPSAVGAKDVIIKTIRTEKGLRYLNWVETNRKKVDSATGGKVAYIHIPDMGFEGLNEFVKYFYTQLRKEGLIVDDRYNGGGFVSQMILERLRRVMTMAAIARNQKVVGTYPEATFTGPMVCMLNEFSASDGDIFPYNFKKNNLGTLIGKRSWGGVVGIRGSLPFLDGSYLMKPEFSHFSTDGQWVLEGVGMEPDIEVDNDPALEYQGIDQQLIKALEVIKEEMKTSTKPKIPEVPPYPKK